MRNLFHSFKHINTIGAYSKMRLQFQRQLHLSKVNNSPAGNKLKFILNVNVCKYIIALFVSGSENKILLIILPLRQICNRPGEVFSCHIQFRKQRGFFDLICIFFKNFDWKNLNLSIISSTVSLRIWHYKSFDAICFRHGKS